MSRRSYRRNGTLCAKAGLPKPEFRSEGERFITVIWREWLTDEFVTRLGLNKRQTAATDFLRTEGSITSGQYQKCTGASRQTASRDLEEMVRKGMLERQGERRGTFYVKAKKMPRKYLE